MLSESSGPVRQLSQVMVVGFYTVRLVICMLLCCYTVACVVSQAASPIPSRCVHCWADHTVGGSSESGAPVPERKRLNALCADACRFARCCTRAGDFMPAHCEAARWSSAFAHPCLAMVAPEDVYPRSRGHRRYMSNRVPSLIPAPLPGR